MTTRFNTFGSTGGLALENTLLKVKDKLNATLDVNVVTQPGGGGPVDLSGINGVPPSVGSGNSNTGTLRTVIASDQPAVPVSLSSGSVDTNATQIKGVTITTGAGSVDNGCQRVTVATNSVLATNLTTIGNPFSGYPVSVNYGNGDDGSFRVTVATDQPELKVNPNLSKSAGIVDPNTVRVAIADNTLEKGIGFPNTALTTAMCVGQTFAGWADIPTKINKVGRIFNVHNAIWVESFAGVSSNIHYVLDNSQVQFQSELTGRILDTNIWIPTVPSNAYLRLDDTDDNLLGNGWNGCRVYYYNSDSTHIPSFNDIVFGPIVGGLQYYLIAADVYRIIRIIPLMIGGIIPNPLSLGVNQSAMVVVSTNNPLTAKFYPGLVPEHSNKWQSSLISFPNLSLITEWKGSPFLNTPVLDYLNLIFNNAGEDHITMWIRQNNGYWILLQRFTSDSDKFVSLPLYNAILVPGSSYDILFTVRRQNTTGDFNLTLALGAHME